MILWRAILGLLSALALVGCADPQTQERALRVLMAEPAAEKGQFPRFTPLYAARKGPAIDVRVMGSNLRGGFIRESQQGTIETWLGTDGVGLIFDRGVLHATRGLGAGLLASDVEASARLILAGRAGHVQRRHTFLDGNDRAVVHIYRCEIASKGQERLRLGPSEIMARRIVEDCRNEDVTFRNIYWVRGDRIVQSQQWVGFEMGALLIKDIPDF